MEKMKYPLGVQTFSEIIKNGYSYVDKTMYIPRLLAAGKLLFLSRPRRFGKSLTLSMLHSYFTGDKEMFRGLAVDGMDMEWEKYPVIHIDFNPEDYTRQDGLDNILDRSLRAYEKLYCITEIESTVSGRFEAIITKAEEKTGKKVVVLIDEYDKPLLMIADNPGLFEKNQATLKGFYGVLKTKEPHIRFGMLTGVARFNKISIFSDLNMLRDISLEDKFADICGWSQEELESVFSSGIRLLAEKYSLSYDAVLEKLRYYYDGYLFASQGNRLYNPFSVLNALGKEEFGEYWFSTGTPTFLARRVISQGIRFSSYNGIWATRNELESAGITDLNPVPLLFQTGYLTIKRVEDIDYELKFPNREVESGFADQLARLYVNPLTDMNGEFGMRHFRADLKRGNPNDFMRRMQALIKSIPYEQHHEKFYQNIVYLVFTLLGADARLEEHSNIGRPDLTVRTKDYVYIFEFKYEGSVAEAMAQIHERDYAGRFAMSGKHIFMIGANFSKGARGLEEWEITEVSTGKKGT